VAAQHVTIAAEMVDVDARLNDPATSTIADARPAPHATHGERPGAKPGPTEG
jgi:hypothetical protein